MIGASIRVGLTLGALLGLPLAHSTTSQTRALRSGTPSYPTLGTLPHDCPANPTSSPTSRLFRMTGFKNSRFGAGAYPIWGLNFTGGSHATLGYGIEKPPHLDYRAGYGWSHKMAWVIADSFRGRVTLRGRDMQGGDPVRFMVSGSRQHGSIPAQVLVYDVATLRALTARPQRPLEVPSDIAVPHAGCYALDARWPGGTWRLYFGAGVGPD